MRYTGRRVCCALLSAVLITGGLPCGAGATGFPGRMTARAAVGIESLKDGKATLSEAEKPLRQKREKPLRQRQRRPPRQQP